MRLEKYLRQGLKKKFDEVSKYYTPLKRLDMLFRCVGLAEAVERLYKYVSFKPKMDFWLHEYKVKHVETRNDYPILEKKKLLQDGEKATTMTISGGIELKALILDLKDGNIKAFRDIVIKSRPDGNVLTWRVPLGGWRSFENSKIEVVEDTFIEDTSKGLSLEQKLGTSLFKRFSPVDSSGILMDMHPNKDIGGISIDVEITPDSFINETNDDTLSKAIEKSSPKKDSVSWKFKYSE